MMVELGIDSNIEENVNFDENKEDHQMIKQMKTKTLHQQRTNKAHFK